MFAQLTVSAEVRTLRQAVFAALSDRVIFHSCVCGWRGLGRAADWESSVCDTVLCCGHLWVRQDHPDDDASTQPADLLAHL